MPQGDSCRAAKNGCAGIRLAIAAPTIAWVASVKALISNLVAGLLYLIQYGEDAVDGNQPLRGAYCAATLKIFRKTVPASHGGGPMGCTVRCMISTVTASQTMPARMITKGAKRLDTPAKYQIRVTFR